LTLAYGKGFTDRNLTLLEKPINIVAGNDFYTMKIAGCAAWWLPFMNLPQAQMKNSFKIN
jgi:hypothetical protein